MQISVIGCGYVGLVTGACLAEIGHDVVCADKDESIINALKDGKSPIYEPHLDEMLARCSREGRLTFTTNSAEAVRSSDIIFICVGVPQMETGDADPSAIESVARLIATASPSEKLVVVRSGVPVETGQKIRHLLAVYSRGDGHNFRVAANPQFLREGTGVEDLLHPDRILVGVSEPETEQQLREAYQPILDRRFVCPIHTTGCPPSAPPKFVATSVQSAELIKHVSNSFLAMKISYANMVGDLCEQIGGDVQQVTRALGLDRRIGSQFLNAGLGFGGPRLPRDIRALCRLADRIGIDFGMLEEAERINQQRVNRFLARMQRALWVIKDKRIGFLGLAAKPDTDDIRSSPAIELIRRLVAEGAQVRAYDPQALAKAQAECPQLTIGASPYEAAEGADALLIATEWNDFRELDWERIRDAMARPLVFDGRNLMDPRKMKLLGFEYHSVGRPD
ncbi:MAG: UDP-glucose/GDP-mannose dehydrogenase family protein [Acidobacteriia bacterium]|nr:UDP-glucose/GDP-mannose dehydrogenase family protein [Terriglobia bacterium]